MASTEAAEGPASPSSREVKGLDEGFLATGMRNIEASPSREVKISESPTRAREPHQAPENREQWISTTQANMNRAKSLASDVLRRLKANESADAANKEAEADGQKREKDRLRTKVRGRVKVHAEVISTAQKSIREIEEAITQVEGCTSRATCERYARFAFMKVCEKRLEIRQKRPPQENFRDGVQEALERERTVLTRAREELLAQEADSKRTLSELEDMRTELSKDTGARRLAVHYEVSQLRPTLEVLAPSGHGAANSQNSASGSKAALLPQVDTAALMRRSAQLIDYSRALQGKLEKVIIHAREESNAAAARTGRSLSMKVRELLEMKRVIEEQMKEVEHALNQAGQALAKEEYRLENYVGDKAGQEQRVADLRNMVKELQATRASLVEDLRCKNSALDVDNSCKRVTSQMASEPQKKPTAAALQSSASMTSGGSVMAPTGSSSIKFSLDAMQDASSTASTATPANAVNKGHSLTRCGSNPGGSSSLKMAAAASLQLPPTPSGYA